MEFLDEGDEFFVSQQRELVQKEFTKRFGEGEEDIDVELSKGEYIKALKLISAIRLASIDDMDLLTAFSHLYETKKENWNVPKEIGKSLLVLMGKVNHIISSTNEIPTFSITTVEKLELEQPENPPEEEIRPREKLDFSFHDSDDEGDKDEDDIIVTKEEVDEWWSSAELGTVPNVSIDKLRKRSKKDYAEMAELLNENLDYETLGEDLEEEFSKLDSDENQISKMDEDTLDEAIASVLGGTNALVQVATGKVDPNAIDKATLRVMMTDLGFSDEEDIDLEVIKQHLSDTEELYHDIRDPIEPQEEQIDENEEIEEVEYEYVDEDGNVVENPGSDEEYEYVYEEVHEEGDEEEEEEDIIEENDTAIIEGDAEYYGIESDEELDGTIEDQFSNLDFDDDEDETILPSKTTSWDDLLSDL